MSKAASAWIGRMGQGGGWLTDRAWLWRDGRRAITRFQLLVTYGQPTSAVAVAPVASAGGGPWAAWAGGPRAMRGRPG
jgi:hypothetical protein